MAEPPPDPLAGYKQHIDALESYVGTLRYSMSRITGEEDPAAMKRIATLALANMPPPPEEPTGGKAAKK